LLITVTLLAFLVLLLVSLASLTRVETQVASNNQSLSQARQNALMALNIALGQLQKYTGPDQRVTAAADIAAAADGGRLPGNSTAKNTSSANGTLNGLTPVSATASVQSGTRWWTGVWGRAASTSSPKKTIYEETPSPVLLNWLVSGNEDRSFTTDTAVATYGQVTSSTAGGSTSANTALFTPGAPVNWAAAGLNTANPAGWTGNYSNLEIKSSGQKAALLVGPKTAGVNPDAAGGAAVDRYVVAPMKDITVASSTVPGAGASGTTTIGRYAWWVGDEGVKASYALADPNAGKTTPGGTDADAAKSRIRLMSASRSGVELVTGFSAYPAADDTNAAIKLGRMLQMPQAPLLDATLLAETQRARFHDFTVSSSGILSDTLNGGLRQDLTYTFEPDSNAWNSSPLKGQNIIPATWSPNWGTSAAPDYAPKWDWLYSFYNTNPDANQATPSLTVRPETSTEVGITPVITQFRMIVFTDPDQPVASVDVGDMPLPVGNYSVPMRCNVAFVLANPYNVTLNIPANTYEFAVKNTYTKSTNPSMPSDPKTIPPGLIIFASDVSHSATASYGTFVFMRDPSDSTNPSMLDQVRFVVPEVSIPPGGNCVLSVNGNSQVGGTGSTTASSAGAEDPVNLEVNTVSNPIGGTSAYFTARTKLNFSFDTLPAPPKSSKTTISFYVNLDVALTTTLRRTADQAVLQQLTDCAFSKKGAVALGSHENNIIGNFHTTFIPPAWRDLDATGGAGKFYNALLAYARPYQDLNLRAAIVDRTAVDSLSLWTPTSYGAGSARSGSMSLSGNFTQDLSPATWAENFGTGTTVSPDGGATRAPVASQGVLFDFPRRTSSTQPPVLSIGALQHVSLTADDWHPGHTINTQSGYAVGNSYSAPFVTRGSSIQSRSSNWYKAPSSTRFFDLAYLLNTALWDGYYFSSIPQTGSSITPINPRYGIYDGATATDVRSKDSAAHLLVKGAFNINSTSHDAWVALLGGLDTLRVNNDSASDGVPYPRTLWQPVTNTKTGSSYTSSGTGDDAYAGYRRLSALPADEIDKLATEIVKRVRARGPFVSLSHFINRSLVAASGAFNSSINDADTSGNLAASTIPMGRGLSGPLQAALDSTASGINTFHAVGSSNVVTANGAGAYGDRMLFAGEILSSSAQKPVLTNTGTAYFADKLVDLPNLDPFYNTPDSPPGPQGRTSTGIPGWLLQGDLLQALGPALSARSDTFVIRTYGEALNPTDSTQTQARAWCEAVVQRLPAYSDPAADSPQTAPASLTSQNNKTFGRSFKIISFRWLTSEDI
jgi:hypothetical protein